MFLHLGEVALCRRCPMRPSCALPSGQLSYQLQRFHMRRLRGSFCGGGLAMCVVWLLIWLVARPWLVWMPLAAVYRDLVKSWHSQLVQQSRICLLCRRRKKCGSDPWVRKIPWCNPLQCSSLGNPTDRGAWQATVQSVTKSRTRLSDSAHMVKSLLIVESWGAPGLMLASHGESQGPRCSRAVAHTLVGETRSWAWCQTTGRQSWFLKSGCRARDPRVCFRSVVVGAGEGCAGSWHSWVWGPRCPGYVGLLLGVVVVQLVPRQGLACAGKSVS